MTTAVGLGGKLYANADPLMRLIADLIHGYNRGSLFPTWSRKLWVSCLYMYLFKIHFVAFSVISIQNTYEEKGNIL